MWLEEVIDAEVSDDQVYEQMALNHDSVKIYGTGSGGKRTTELLQSHGIAVDGYVTSAKYYTKEYLGKPVLLLNDFLSLGGGLCMGVGAQAKDECDTELFEIITKLKGSPKVHMYSLKDIINNHDDISCAFLRENYDEFNRTYEELGDTLSKECFLSYLKGVVSGKAYHKMADKKSYFNDLTKNFLGKAFVDCGAFNGDTIEKFLAFRNGEYEKIFAVEADLKTVKELEQFIYKKGLKNVVVLPKGASDFKGEVHFDSRNNLGSTISSEGDMVIEVDTIDNMVGNCEVSFIKMDIEGSELQALKGAVKTITINMPALAVCVYHRRNDLISIPAYLRKFQRDGKKYVFYLRKHHFASNDELVMYAIPE